MHLVAHSLGGLVARYYVQRLGGDARVHTLVTLGTPHSGTQAARLGPPYAVLGQLRPGSELLTELAEASPGCRTRVVCVWSDLDQMVVPQHNARMEHPDIEVLEVAVHGVGHMTLPVHPAVVHEVCLALVQVDDRIRP